VERINQGIATPPIVLMSSSLRIRWLTDFVNYPIRGDKPTHMGARSQAEAAGKVRVWTMGGQDGHFPHEVIGDERFAADHVDQSHWGLPFISPDPMDVAEATLSSAPLGLP
jgi:hypothetical protein